ncbi:MAG: YlbF family regulator [Bacteroidetes bacterium]|nr:YlbF family regulator [Bacteroidota bacterium]
MNAQDSLKKNFKHRADTLKKINQSADSVYLHNYKSLDSLQKKFNNRTDSLQQAYASPMKKLDAGIARLKHKKDSLSKLNLPTASLTHKIDSLQSAHTAKLNELNTKVEKTKKETLDKISSLHLPPQAQNEINTFTKNINGFKVPNNFFQLPNGIGIPNLKMTGLPSLSLPSGAKIPSLNLPSNLSIPSMNIPSLQKMNISSLKMPSLAQMEGSLGSEIKKLQSLKSADAKFLEKEAMNLAGQNKEAKSLLQEQSKVKDMQKQLAGIKDPKSADSLAMQQLQPTVNHFEGKEKELTAAMDKVSKLKQKYSSVKSLAELPKRAPNPLKDKPWIERLVPGLNYFIQTKHYTLIDFNPYVGWRFNPRLTASIGWNQRIGISHYSFTTHTYDHVYGVRGSVSYLWTHGINFKVSPEMMDAYIPTNGSPDVKHETLVFGVYAGVRKDFSIYKSIKGYSEVMYNFTQKTFQNIYGDPVSFRFGIEMKVKKKAQTKK